VEKQEAAVQAPQTEAVVEATSDEEKTKKAQRRRGGGTATGRHCRCGPTKLICMEESESSAYYM